MNPHPASTTGGKKRSREERAAEDREVIRVVEQVKKRKVELDTDGSLFESQDGKKVRLLRGNAFSASAIAEEYETRDPEEDPVIWHPDNVADLFDIPMEDKDDERLQLLAAAKSSEDDTQSPQDTRTPLSNMAEAPVIEHSQKEAANESLPQRSEQIRPRNLSLSSKRPVPPIAYGRRSQPKRNFPPADVPMKEGVSLEKHCEDWPLHLVGIHLRRFIQEDWTAAGIFVSMHPESRESLSKEAALAKKKSWEVIKQRLDDEKKQIEAEELGRRLPVRKTLSKARNSTTHPSSDVSKNRPASSVCPSQSQERASEEYDQSHDSLAASSCTHKNPAPNTADVPSKSASTTSTVAASPAPSATSSVAAQRGPPRKRMFITMPETSQPLSEAAKVSDEEVLTKFPEHLSLPKVMKRFIQPDGSRSGGWTTADMVEILMSHPNAYDHPNISEDEKRRNVKAWVKKQRESCNRQIRKELGLQKKSQRSDAS